MINMHLKGAFLEEVELGLYRRALYTDLEFTHPTDTY